MKNISKIILCDTLSHPTPILLEWSYGLIDLGYETLYLPIPQHSVTEIDEPADVLVYAGYCTHNQESIMSLSSKFLANFLKKRYKETTDIIFDNSVKA